MLEQISLELLKLQEELEKLGSASEQIAKAGRFSADVVESVKSLQEKYQDQLDKIQSLVSEYLNKTYQHTEENLTKLFVSFQERVKEEEALLKHFSELSMQTEDLLKDFVKKVTEDNSKKLQSLAKEAEAIIAKQKKITEDYSKAVEKKIAELTKAHEEKMKTEEAVLANYLDLAETTAKLSQYLQSVNFPSRLDAIEEKQSSLEEQIKALTKLVSEKMEILEANDLDMHEMTKKNKSKITTVQWVVIIVAILSLAYYGMVVYFYYNGGDLIRNMFFK